MSNSPEFNKNQQQPAQSEATLLYLCTWAVLPYCFVGPFLAGLITRSWLLLTTPFMTQSTKEIQLALLLNTLKGSWKERTTTYNKDCFICFSDNVSMESLKQEAVEKDLSSYAIA